MKLKFTFLSGSRTGESVAIGKSYVGIGRHPLSDVRFDAHQDLEVSARHAAILQRGPEYVLRDLESRNGTFVNGDRVSADRVLHAGDIVRFGVDGPSVEFGFVENEVEAALEERESKPARPATPPRRPDSKRKSNTERIRVEVARQTATLRRTTLALVVVLLAVVAVFFFVSLGQQRDRKALLTHLQARADSVAASAQQTIANLRTELQGLAGALRETQGDAQRLQRELAQASAADVDEMERLRAQLQQAEDRQRAMVLAAGVDYSTITDRNRRAVAIIAVDFGDGEFVTGTAFAVRPDRILATARHNVVHDTGRQPRRIAIKFTDSNQWWEGRVERISPNADVALVSAALRGNVPSIERISETTQVGSPVAVLGFPLGLDTPMEGQGLDAYASPTLTVGTVSKIVTGTLQLDGYGTFGSSGSPVLDREGAVIGMIRGGQQGTLGRILNAVPARVLAELLAGLDTGQASGRDRH